MLCKFLDDFFLGIVLHIFVKKSRGILGIDGLNSKGKLLLDRLYGNLPDL